MCYDSHLTSSGFNWHFNKCIHDYTYNKSQYLQMIETGMIYMWLFIKRHI